MTAASDYMETQALKWALTTATVTRPTTWYLGLFTTATTDAGGGTEVSGGSYARQAVTFSVTGDTASNTANILFPVATAAWGSIGYVAVYDSLTGGNSLFHGAATSAKTIDTGDA